MFHSTRNRSHRRQVSPGNQLATSERRNTEQFKTDQANETLESQNNKSQNTQFAVVDKLDDEGLNQLIQI